MKTAEERFDLGLEAIDHLNKAIKAISDANLNYGGVQKSVLDLVTYLSANMFILNPERAQRVADENAHKVAQPVKDTPGFVAENRPGSGMYDGYL